MTKFDAENHSSENDDFDEERKSDLDMEDNIQELDEAGDDGLDELGDMNDDGDVGLGDRGSDDMENEINDVNGLMGIYERKEDPAFFGKTFKEDEAIVKEDKRKSTSKEEE